MSDFEAEIAAGLERGSQQAWSELYQTYAQRLWHDGAYGTLELKFEGDSETFVLDLGDSTTPLAVTAEDLRDAIAALSTDVRSADRTRIGLGMKAAVVRIVVFVPARFTERKTVHGGVAPVIGNIRNDGIARPAVGAVDKRVLIPSVLRVEQLPETVAANRYIR